MKSPELLVPVNRRSLKGVERYADAIYFGISEFNMRMNAQNFSKKDLPSIVKFCHNRKNPLKAYLCTNILIYNSELETLENLISYAKKCGVDAVIVHDIAAIQFAKKYGLNFHISTQANISNIESALFYENLGAERLILARELSLTQIKEIKNELTGTEIECFIHGSMCTSISGRCYFSASIMDSSRYSANRGNCVQPCRRRWKVIDDMDNKFIYDGKLFLNSKDLCMIEFIPELIESKIDAFKIEGRMKDPLYIETVARCYREAIDSYVRGTFTIEKVKKWKNKLKKVYNRGFHTGFYFKTPGIEELELDKRGNISPYKKVKFGRVISYNENSKTANIEIQNTTSKLCINDTLIIKGKNGTYTQKVEKMMKNGVKINSISCSPNEKPMIFNIVLKRPVNTNDKVFIISQN